MKNLLKLMRLKHYIKNSLIFFPLIFSGKLTNINSFFCCLISFFAFSLSASFVYIINDIRDKENDAKHDIKKNRPIASGKVSVKNALFFAILLLIISFLLNYFATNELFNVSFILLIIYIIINIMYSFGFKNIPLLDIVILVIGFLIRVLYGATIINVEVSNWLYLTIIAISFYLGLGKRRNEMLKSGSKSRNVLKYYNKDFLDKNMYMCLSLAIVFYSLWTVNVTTAKNLSDLFIWTVPLIILICMKYSMDIEGDSYGDPADVIINDKTLLLLLGFYGIIMLLLIYIPKF